MLKTLLLTAASLASLSAMAVEVYTTDILGEPNGISPNGKYAVVSDDDNKLAYIWCKEKPTEWVNITPDDSELDVPKADQRIGATVYGITNDGMAVGALVYGDHTEHPAIYKNGEWSDLPMHVGAQSTNCAIAVTADGSVIGGFMFINDPSGDIPGHFYPCRWVLNDDGDYELIAYTDIKLPDHQGFYPTCMSPDGSIIAGMVFCGVGSYVPCLITADGEFKMFAEIEEKYEPFIYKGKYETRDENGKQGWTDDINDPNVQWYLTTFIDGVKDDNKHPWVGRFNHFDWSGHIYAQRTMAKDVDEEGNGTLYECAAYYDVETGEWTNNEKYTGYSTGLEGRILFPGGSTVIMDDRATTLSTEFGIESPSLVAAVNCTSQSGQVLGIMTAVFSQATGEYEYYSEFAVLDEPLVEVEDDAVEVIPADNNVLIITAPGRIIVTGAKAVAVYDLEGRLVSTKAESSVASGVYVVKADGNSQKVMVK